MELYNLIINEDGSVKVETSLTPQDMKILLTVGLYACMERGVMVKSLADQFQQQPEPTQEVDWEKILEGEQKES